MLGAGGSWGPCDGRLVAAVLAALILARPGPGFAAEPWYMVAPHSLDPVTRFGCNKIQDPINFPEFAQTSVFGIEENHPGPGRILWAVMTQAQLQRIRGGDTGPTVEHRLTDREARLLSGGFRDELLKTLKVPTVVIIGARFIPDVGPFLAAGMTFFNFIQVSPNQEKLNDIAAVVVRGARLSRYVEVTHGDHPFLHDNIVLTVKLEETNRSYLLCSARYALNVLPSAEVRAHAPMCGGPPQGVAVPRLPSLGRHFDKMMDTLSQGGGYPEACRDRLLQDAGAAAGQDDPVEAVRSSVASKVAAAGGRPPRGTRANEDARQDARLAGGEGAARAVGGRGGSLGDLAAGTVATSVLQRQIAAGSAQLSGMAEVMTRGALAKVPPDTLGKVRESLEGGDAAKAAALVLEAAGASPDGEVSRLLAALGGTASARDEQVLNALLAIRPETLSAANLPSQSDVARAVDGFTRLSKVFSSYGLRISEQAKDEPAGSSPSGPGLGRPLIEVAINGLVGHQEEMAKLLEMVAANSNLGVSPQQIRFLADAASGKLPVVQQMDAVRSGMLSFLDGVNGTARGDAIDRLKSLQGAAGQGMATLHAATALARGIDNVFPNLIDEDTSKAIANLEANVATAQQVIGVVSALAVPGAGWMAAVPMVANLLGGGGIPGIGGATAAPPLPPELAAALARIERSLAQVNQKLDRVIELQQQTIERLDQMRLQMTRDRVAILASLDDLTDVAQEGLELLKEPYRDWLKDCRTLLGSSFSGQDQRVFVTLSERQGTMSTTARTAINNCLNGLSARSGTGQGAAPGNGGFVATLSSNDMGTMHLTWPFLVLTSDEDRQTNSAQLSDQQKQDALARAGQRRVSGFYRAMSDYNLAIAATPAAAPALSATDHKRCHGRMLALLASAPRFMATLPSGDGWGCPPHPVPVEADAGLPFEPWKASPSQDAEGLADSQFEAWRFLEAHLNHERIVERAEIVLRGGEWRSLMEMDCIDPDKCERRRILSRESAFGVGGTQVSRGIWRFEGHDTLTEQMLDILSIAVAREAMAAGGSVIPWATRMAMAPLTAERQAGRSAALGYQGEMPGDKVAAASVAAPPHKPAAPAWTLLVAAQDHGETLTARQAEATRRGLEWNEDAAENKPIAKRLAGWNSAQGLQANPVTLVEVLRVLGGDPFATPDGDHRLRSGGPLAVVAVGAVGGDLRSALEREFKPAVFGGDRKPGLSEVTSEELVADVERLRTIAWMTVLPSGYDLPCRIREVETDQRSRERKPDVFRGSVIESRTDYLRRLREGIADPAIASRTAACLMGANPLLAENVVLRAVLERVNAAVAADGWDPGSDVLKRYGDALAEESGDLLRERFLAGWPIERRGSETSGYHWAVRVRLADGSLLRMRLPHAEELRRGEIVGTPQLGGLLQLRDRLREHLVIHGGEDTDGGLIPLPLPGDAATRQVLARGIALRHAEGQLRSIGGGATQGIDRMFKGAVPPRK